jgi:hypothetical protein
VVRNHLNGEPNLFANGRDVFIDDVAGAGSQDDNSENHDIVMSQVVALLGENGQRNAENDQALVAAQLNSQIDDEDPIVAAPNGSLEQKQADAQQPQANGFGARRTRKEQAAERGKDKGDGATGGKSGTGPIDSEANDQQREGVPFGASQEVGVKPRIRRIASTSWGVRLSI